MNTPSTRSVIRDTVTNTGSRKAQVKFLGKSVTVSVLNQVVSSGTNFLLGVYLVRTLSPEEFGLYGIGFAITLFYAGLGNALFLTQMVVHMPNKISACERLLYTANIFTGVSIFCIVTLITIGGATLVINRCWVKSEFYYSYTIPIIFASSMYLLKDFFVRYAYIIQQEIKAVVLHSSIAGCLLLLLLITTVADAHLNAKIALWFYGLAHTVSIIIGLSIIRLPLWNINLSTLIGDLREAWAYGIWGMATNVILWLRTQCHTYLTAILTGPVGVAQLNAARLLVTPAFMLLPSLGQVFFPRLAEAHAKDSKALSQTSAKFTKVMLAVAIIYSILLLLFLDELLPIIFGSKYHSITPLVLAWCIFVIVSTITESGKIVIQVLKKFRFLFLINIVALFALLVSVSVLFILMNLKGIIYALVVSEIVMAVIIWISLR